MASSHNSARRKVGNFEYLVDGTIKVTVRQGVRYDGSARRLIAYAKDEEEAERKALELAAELGRRPDLGKGLTLKRWWQAYSAGKGTRVTKATYKRYEGDMRRVWLPVLGNHDISLISRADVQSVLLSLPTRSQAQHAQRALSAVLSQAVRDGYLTENPIRSGSFEMPGDVGTEGDEDFDWEDPFMMIEKTSDVWDARTVLAAMPLLEGTSIESVWLVMVGAGLRREEALALTWRDVRQIEIDGRKVTQIAVYKAYTTDDGMKRTKTARSVRIAAVVEPFGSRLMELAGNPDDFVSQLTASNISNRWKVLFEPVTSKHAKTMGRHKGKLAGFPFVPLNRMRATHETYMQQAGVLDSVNAAAHGHAEKVSYRHYQRADSIGAAAQASEFLLVEGGRAASEA